MKLNSQRLNLDYQPGKEIFTFPEETGLPFIFDVDEELTNNSVAMYTVGIMLDSAERLAELAKQAIKASLENSANTYHELVRGFMDFHREDVGLPVAKSLFPDEDISLLSYEKMVDYLKLKRFGSILDEGQQLFIIDLSFNPLITDELLVVYLNLNQEIVCIAHES